MSDRGENMTTSRRRFLGTAASATGVALAATVWKGGQVAAAENTGFASGHSFLELDGVNTGALRTVDGGAPFAGVIEEQGAPQTFTKKHLGAIKYEPFEMQLGLGMSKAVYDWIAASWQMNFQRKNGAIVAADFDYDAVSKREFFNALITETTIPTADGASNDDAYFTLKVAAESTRLVKASGRVTPPQPRQKLWLASNFRFELGGLDCTRVNKVDAITVKQTVATDSIGQARDYAKEPATIEFPNLTISLAQAFAETWYEWFDDFVLKGNNGQDKEKTGSLTFLDPTLTDELVRINFFNVGIFKLDEDKYDASSDAIRRVKAELYVERMELKVNLGNTA